MRKKKALYFFPLSPLNAAGGNQARALNLLNYFRSRDVDVDYVSEMHWGKWTKKMEEEFEKTNIATELHVFSRKPPKKNVLNYFFTYKIKHLAYEQNLHLRKGSIPNHATYNLQRQFNTVLSQKKFDYIIISYAYWADLIKDNPHVGDSLTIIDTHDFLASQHQNDPDYNREAAIGDELRRLDLFGQIWAISPEEAYFYSQFFGEKVKYIPFMMDRPGIAQASADKIYDLIYVASDNPHNLRSASWFFEKVYPLLPANLKICVIGKVTEHIPSKANVEKHAFIEDLNEFYSKSKVALCPMLTGTGVKIKVIEAMANALPVVCNERGTDGLPDKTNNGCLVTENAGQFAKNILALLNDNGLYSRYSTEAFKCFERNFSTEQVYEKIDRALNLL